MQNTVILVTTDGMGNTEEKLRPLLLGSYMEWVAQNEPLSRAFCINIDGVRLVCEGSPTMAGPRQLGTKGMRLIIGSTCLDYFELNQKVQVGIVGEMEDILAAQRKPEKVITI